MIEPLTLAQRLRNTMPEYLRGILSSDDVESDLNEAADRIEADEATIASLRDANKAMTAEQDCDPAGCKAHIDAFMERAIAAEAKLAKVEAELATVKLAQEANHNLAVANGNRAREEHDRADRLSAELAEARSLLTLVSCIDLNHSTEHDELLLETVVEDTRSFLASKEVSHAE